MEEDYFKKYYLENKEIMTKRSADWKKQNKEKWNKYQNEWNAKKLKEKKETREDDEGQKNKVG